MFHEFSKMVADAFNHLSQNELFQTEQIDIYESYLAAFPQGSNPIYRERSEHDCNCCKQFIRRVGNLVAIINGKIFTVWDNYQHLPHPYNIVSEKMAELVRQSKIVSVFRTKEAQYGAATSFEQKTGITYNHFVGVIHNNHKRAEPDEDRGKLMTNRGVIKRSLDELTIDALDQVRDLISDNLLYRGEEHKVALYNFTTLKTAYDAADDKELFIWANIKNNVGLFKNTVIGTLVHDLSTGTSLEDAVKMFESKVAPENYKRSSALITPKMIEQAVEKLKELGLETAVHRRFATLRDVSVNDVLFVDRSVSGVMKGGLTELLMDSVSTGTKELTGKTVTPDEFFTEVLHEATSMELQLKNRHVGNFVSLTGADGDERIFKWDNNFAWSYDGDVTDSIKEKVKRAGGNIDAPLRVSLAWFNGDDLDLHARCPDGHVYYSSKMGILDVDMNGLDRKNAIDPVENLSWKNMRDGHYTISVHQYSKRYNERFGFNIELYHNGKSQFFSYAHMMPTNTTIDLFEFKMKNGVMSDLLISKQITNDTASKDKWGIKTETNVKVESIMFSPNHWGDNAVGQKHYFFMLKDCKNPLPTRGIYNEFLAPSLNEHRKVLEVLGSKTKCQPTDDQISGVGFTAGRGDEVTILVTTDKGKTPYSIKF